MGKELEWYKPFGQVLEWKEPFAKWFLGGQFNIVHNCLDRHMKTATKDKVAYICESEPGEVERWTYADLYKDVNKLANAMKKLGVTKGDRVMIFLPMIPQLPVAMLACAKIGAIHSVVFSGFSSTSLRDRILDSEAKLVITADGGYRRGKIVGLKHIADEAVKETPSIKHMIVFNRAESQGGDEGGPRPVVARDNRQGIRRSARPSSWTPRTCSTRSTPPAPPASPRASSTFRAATPWAPTPRSSSRSTSRTSDVWWCAADVGWVTGHSYIVYAPLMMGVTSILYEGAPDYPDAGRWWKIIEREKVTVLYTSPTAIRMHMKYGETVGRASTTSRASRLLGSVGEPINPEAWRWYYKNIGASRCPIMDTWWQTETGNFMITPLPITPAEAGFGDQAASPGFWPSVYDQNGKQIEPGHNGFAVLLKPWPGMLRTIYKDPERYKQTYWVALRRRLSHRRLRDDGRRRLLLVPRPRRRGLERRRPQAGDRRGRIRPGLPSGGCRGRRDRRAARGQGRRAQGLRHAEARLHGLRRPQQGAQGLGRPRRSAR